MCTKTNNALVNHLCATSPVVRLECFHPWRSLFEFNFWQFSFSIFQLFLVLLLSHVMCRFEPCLCRNFSHFYESFSLQFSVAERVCPSLVVLSKIKIFWCTKIPNKLLAQWLHWFCRKLRCWFLFPPESIFLNFYPIIFLVWAEPRKATNWTWAVLGQWAVAR